MRNAFAAELTALAAENPDVVLLSGDIGNRLFDRYKEAAPDRFFNCGAAEGNMIGVAAGLAMSGLRPVAYTITPFVTTRCLEQIKVDICYHKLPVVVVGTGSGLSYASLGASHHSFEDIAIMRVFPNMTIVCPGDQAEVRLALRESLKSDGPVYIRIGKKGEPPVHESSPAFAIGRGIVVQEGDDVCLLSTGNMLSTALQCAQELSLQGVSSRVVSLHTVKPLDDALLNDIYGRFPLVVTIEEHSLLGGLGGGIAEWICRRQLNDRPGAPSCRLLSIGAEDRFLHEAGNQAHARQSFGLNAREITMQILNTLRSAH